jgi:hypothetical protein
VKLSHIARFLLAILLLPLCAAVSLAVAGLLGTLGREASWPELSLAGGFLAWLVVYATLPRPIRTYVLAHELTHALWAYLMGAEVHGMNISRKGGSVVLSGSNMWVTLSPYFFPLYTVVISIVYWICSLAWDLSQLEWLWLALVGLTWSFHLTFTISSLLQHQTDIVEYGRVFSLTVIYLMNVLGMGVWIALVTRARFDVFLKLLAGRSLDTYGWVLKVIAGA